MGQDIELGMQTERNLSFFIPTYGREASLRNSIQSVLNNWKNIGQEQIIVSDNNDSDIAFTVVKEFSELSILYTTNNGNIGIDRNMLKFLSLCSSRYCWLLGDDDAIIEGAQELIDPFLNEDIDCIFLLNGEHIISFENSIHTINTDCDLDKVFNTFWDKVPFGNIIVNVERAKKVAQSGVIEKYIGTSHLYSSIVWELACSIHTTGKFGVINQQVLTTEEIKKTWVDNAVRIYLKEIPEWFKLLPEKLNNAISVSLKNYYQLIFNSYFIITYLKYADQDETNQRLVSSLIKDMPTKYQVKFKLYRMLFLFYKIIKNI